MMIIIALTVLSGLLALVSGKDKQCDEWSPCFREGYCNVNAQFCMWDFCDPKKSYNSTSCWEPEKCIDQWVHFNSSSDCVPIANYTGDAEKNYFTSLFVPNNAGVEDDHLVLGMTYDPDTKRGFGATVSETHTIHYGVVTARIKSASVAKGIVSSFIVRNDQFGDEIDFEFVGKDPNQVQTNYYWRNILDYQKMVPYNLGVDTSADYHNYTIFWNKDQIDWLVDAKVVRTLNRNDTKYPNNDTYAFPDTRSRVFFSIWDGGLADGEGTRFWAGTPTPWNVTAVYKAYVGSVKITCGDNVTLSDNLDM